MQTRGANRCQHAPPRSGRRAQLTGTGMAFAGACRSSEVARESSNKAGSNAAFQSVGVLRANAGGRGGASNGLCVRPSAKARAGSWHVAHERVPGPDSRGSRNSRKPSAIRAGEGRSAKSGAYAEASNAPGAKSVTALWRHKRASGGGGGSVARAAATARHAGVA